MDKEFSKKIMGNFDKKNIENIDKLINEPMTKMAGMFVDESGNGESPQISKESRKICAKSLLR